MGTYLKFGSIPTLVVRRLTFHITKLNLIGCLRTVHIYREQCPEQYMMILPVCGCFKVDTRQFRIQNHILIDSGICKPSVDPHYGPHRSCFHQFRCRYFICLIGFLLIEHIQIPVIPVHRTVFVSYKPVACGSFFDKFMFCFFFYQ